MIRLKELREERNLDQKVLAIDLQVSQPTISDWEGGRKIPSIANVLRLADYFHVSIDYLMHRSDVRYPASDLSPSTTAVTTLLASIETNFGEGSYDILQDYSSMNETGRKAARDLIRSLTFNPAHKKEEEVLKNA